MHKNYERFPNQKITIRQSLKFGENSCNPKQIISLFAIHILLLVNKIIILKIY